MAIAWREADFLGKFRIFITILWNAPLFFIIDPLLEKFVCVKHDMPNSTVKLVCPNIFQCSYWRGQSNSTFVRANDGSVLVHLPPPPQAATLAAVRDIGDVKVIISTGMHDTYVGEWARLFPDAKVLAPDAAIDWVTVRIDGKLCDNAELLAKYFVVDVIETKAFTRSNDATLIFEIVGKKAALMCCGIGNWNTSIFSPLSIHMAIGGFCGLRVFRQFALLFCYDVDRFTKHVRDVARLVPSIVLFQHGEPIRHNVAALANVRASRSLLYYPSPFALN